MIIFVSVLHALTFSWQIMEKYWRCEPGQEPHETLGFIEWHGQRNQDNRRKRVLKETSGNYIGYFKGDCGKVTAAMMIALAS